MSRIAMRVVGPIENDGAQRVQRLFEAIDRPCFSRPTRKNCVPDNDAIVIVDAKTDLIADMSRRVFDMQRVTPYCNGVTMFERLVKIDRLAIIDVARMTNHGDVEPLAHLVERHHVVDMRVG